MVARDTRSDVAKVTLRPPASCIDAGAAVIIGPDTTDLVTQLRPVLQDRTTDPAQLRHRLGHRMEAGLMVRDGSGRRRVACELVAQLRADARKNPLVIVNPSGYNSWLAWEFSNRYGMA